MADSQFILNIAATLEGGAATEAELEKISEQLTGAGRRSDAFQSALRSVTAELDAAKAATVGANAALREGQDQYAQLEREAIRASKALEKANSKGRFDPRAALSAHEASAALDGYTGTIRKLEAESAKANAEQDKLAKRVASVGQVGKLADANFQAQNRSLRALSRATVLLPGPLRSVASEFLAEQRAELGLRNALGTGAGQTLIYVGAAVGLAAAVAVVTAAIVAGAAAFASYSAHQADAARTADLSRQAFAALDPAAKAATATFGTLEAATGLSEARLVALSNQLREAHVSASDMPTALRAVATAERALGQGGSAEFVKRITDGTQSIDAMASEVRTKLAPIVAQQMRGLDAQFALFGAHWNALFSGVNLEPVLNAIGTLVADFEKGAPLAEFFRTTIAGLFEPFAANAEQAGFAVEAFALGFAIQATKMYIFLKPTLKSLDDLGISLTNAKDLGAATADVIGGLAASFLALGFGIYAVIHPMDAALLATKLIAQKVNSVSDETRDAGFNIGAGLAEGILGGIPFVSLAATKLAAASVSASKEELDIHSPSKVMAGVGDDTVAGYTGALDAGQPEAQASMAALVRPGAGYPADSGGSSGGAPARGGLNLAGASFTFHGVKDAEHARDLLSEMFTDLLEGDARALTGA